MSLLLRIKRDQHASLKKANIFLACEATIAKFLESMPIMEGN